MTVKWTAHGSLPPPTQANIKNKTPTMIPLFSIDPTWIYLPLAIVNLWHAAPLIVSVSLVCAATRHELMAPILIQAVRFAVWVIVFMAVFMVLLSWMQYLAS